MTQSLRLPWPVALALLLPLALPVPTALTDLRAGQLLRRADAQQAQSQFDGALALRQQAAQVSPRDAGVQLTLAEQSRALWFLRDTPELRRAADTAFDRAAALSPHWPVPHYEHARMYAFRGQHSRALTLLEPALRLDPNNAGYWLERARSLEALGRREKARAAYARCWAIDTVGECEGALKRLGGRP